MLISILFTLLTKFYSITSELDNYVFSLLGLDNIEPSLVRKYASMFCFGLAALLLIWDNLSNDNKPKKTNKVNDDIKTFEINNNLETIKEDEGVSPTTFESSESIFPTSPVLSKDEALKSVETELASKIIVESDDFIQDLVFGLDVCKVKGSQLTNEKKTYRLTGKGYLLSDKSGLFGQISQNYKLSRLSHILYKDKEKSSFVLKFIGNTSVKLLEIRAFDGNTKTIDYYNGFLAVLKRAKLDNNRKWFKANIALVAPGQTPADSTVSSVIGTPVVGTSRSRSSSIDSFQNKSNKLNQIVEAENEVSPDNSPERLPKYEHLDEVVFTMDIIIEKGVKRMLSVKKSDDSHALAAKFAKENDLSREAEHFISTSIKERQQNHIEI